MLSTRKQKIVDLLKGIETGNPDSVKVVNEKKYIQHNPHTKEGGEGLAELFSRLSRTNPKVEIVRIFEDGDYVFAHTIYDFSSVRIGFEVFRYEGNYVVEHWDNIQPRIGDMVGGSVEICDLHLTERNREFAEQFIDEVCIGKNHGNADSFLGNNSAKTLLKKVKNVNYQKNHRSFAEGNFVLTTCEGYQGNLHSSFYDLFRFKDNLIVEHWDTTEEIPLESEWRNNNGKF